MNYMYAHTGEVKLKRVGLAEKLWKDNGPTFRFPEPVSSATSIGWHRLGDGTD